MKKVCPICQQSFDNEEFCPTHFTQLVAPAAPEKAEEQETSSATESPSESKQDGSKDQQDGLLKGLQKRVFGSFKKKADKNAQPESQAAASKAEDPITIALPPEVREKGWSVTGAPVSLRGIDVWPVQCTSEEVTTPGQLVVYASGVLTDVQTYHRQMDLPPSHFRAHLHAFGTLDRGHKVRSAFELLTLPGEWKTLGAWLADSPAGEERALSLLFGFREMVNDWHEHSIFPMGLDPSMVQRNAKGQLRLVRFGAQWIASADSSAAVYRPELAHSGLLPSPWAAPEVKGRLVVAPQSAAFSVAQILAAALFGQPPSLHDVQSGLVPFHSIQDPLLARLLMGCLWPHADGRWTFSQLFQALSATSIEQMPEAPAWSRLMPGAAETAFDLGGESCYRLEDAVARANQPAHWEEAVQRMDALLLWATGTAWKGVAEGLRNELTTGARTGDWVLMRLTRQVRPDLPLTWRGLDFSDTHAQASLTNLAQQALTSETPDFSLLQQLVRADLRGAFTVPA